MKADRRISDIEQLTTSEIAQRIAAVDTQIAEKEVAREALEAQLPRLLAEHRGSELAAAKERAQLRELSSYLDDLRRTRAVLDAQRETALRHEWEAKFRDKLAEAKRQGEALVEESAAMAEDVVRLVKRASHFQVRVAEWESALPGVDPGDFMRGELSAGLMRRLEMAMYVESEGRLRPLKIIESAFEMRQAGRGDLKRVTREHVTVALRNRTLPRIGS